MSIKNKNGFTLVELLGVITILSVILLVTIPMVSGVLKEYEVQKYESFKNNIFQATEVYINENIDSYERLQTVGGFVYIHLDDLVDNGYLKSTLTDPSNGSTITEELDYTIKITYQEENKPYIYEFLDYDAGYDDLGPKVEYTQNMKTIDFTLTDDYEMTGYACSISNIVEPTYNSLINEENRYEYSNSCTFDDWGTYYLWAKDINDTVTTTTIDLVQMCEFEPDKEWEFIYTGAIQEFEIPCNGSYKMLVYGAQGGSSNISGGKGGYTYGEIYLTAGTKLYIAVGGAGKAGGPRTTAADPAGGFNGGGRGENSNITSSVGWYGGSGGGATHIAKVGDTLANIGATSGITYGNLYVVAGGGGGSGAKYGWEAPSYNFVHVGYQGGAGGGINGATGSGAGSGYVGTGGTQTKAGSNTGGTGAFGLGASSTYYGGGGGAGLYGGGGRYAYGGAGGGSGYISGAMSYPTITTGVRSGNGYAKIILKQYEPLDKPIIESLETYSNYLYFTARDETGVVAYQITNSAVNPTTGWTDITATPTYTTEEHVDAIGTYFLHVKDTDGNITTSSAISVTFLSNPYIAYNYDNRILNTPAVAVTQTMTGCYGYDPDDWGSGGHTNSTGGSMSISTKNEDGTAWIPTNGSKYLDFSLMCGATSGWWINSSGTLYGKKSDGSTVILKSGAPTNKDATRWTINDIDISSYEYIKLVGSASYNADVDAHLGQRIYNLEFHNFIN